MAVFPFAEQHMKNLVGLMGVTVDRVVTSSLKQVSMGFKYYCMDGFNIFDMFIVWVSIIEMVVTPASLPPSLTYSLAYSLTYSLTYSLKYSLKYSLTYSLT